MTESNNHNKYFKYTKSQVLDFSVWKIIPLPNSIEDDCSKYSAHLLPRYDEIAPIVKHSTTYPNLTNFVPTEQQDMVLDFMKRILELAPSETVYACIVSMWLVLEENSDDNNNNWSKNIARDKDDSLTLNEKNLWCTEEERDMIYEAWTFVQEKSKWNVFATIYVSIRQNMHLASIQHPLVQYVQTILPNLNHKDDVDLVQKLLLSTTSSSIQASTKKVKKNSDTQNSSGGSYNSGNPILFMQQQIVDLYEAKPVTFAILINPPSVTSKEDEGKETLSLTHSCCPNASLDVIISSKEQKQPKVSLVMLDSIEEEEDLTVGMVDITGTYAQRIKILQEQRFPVRQQKKKHQKDKKQNTTTSLCNCWRCLTDCNDKNSHLLPPARHAIRLGHLAMQQGRYEDARKFYRYVTQKQAKDNKYDGDLWHALGAAYLQERRFLKAQQYWRDQVEKHSSLRNHAGIALQLQKQRAYHYFDTPLDETKDTENILPNYAEIYKRLCFVTKDPIVNSAECGQVIQWAEESMDSWTTSRHYAVPTTDVPVHTVPTVLRWFMDLMDTKICPLLSRQFANSLSSKQTSSGRNITTKKRFYVHDAFIVRYEATRTNNHLPLHVDESTHSFVLALNDNYKGGATYFVDYDETHRLSTGHLLSFRGDSLRHGGNVVTEGTRYILAAFLYSENVTLTNDTGTIATSNKIYRAPKNDSSDDVMPQPSNDKKCKMQRLFQDEKAQNDSSSFSFGFTL